MMQYWSHGKYTLIHKWYVFQACCEFGIPWRGLVHDLSKFRPSEFIAYANHFFTPDGKRITRHNSKGYYSYADTGDLAFDYASRMHTNRNRHHWQYWCAIDAHKEIASSRICGPEVVLSVVPAEMPEVYVREMVADWIGAGKARGNTRAADWYNANKDTMVLHQKTRYLVEYLLGGYYGNKNDVDGGK